MDIVFVVGFGAILVATLFNWRAGLLLTLIAGFLQDPLRKSVENEPVLLTGLVAGSFAMVLLGMGLKGAFRRPQRIKGWREYLRAPTLALALVVVLQVVHTVVRTGNPRLALIGFGGYLAPLPAAWLAYRFAGSERSVRMFLAWYLLLVVAVSTGVYLSFLGYEWSILRQVGPGLRVFSAGNLLEVHPGFWRSPEVAAWHAGAGVCLLVVLWAQVRHLATRWWIAGAMVYLVGAILLTGRRKMLVEIVVFLAIYGALLAYLRYGARKLATVALAAGLGGALLAAEVFEGPADRIDPYLRHGVSGFRDAPERFEALGLGSIHWAIRRHGLLGIGAGMVSQGAQHFGGGSAGDRGTAEGGLGRVVTELGLPGLLGLAWLVLALARLAWRSISRGSVQHRNGTTTCGLAALLVANGVTFVVASQVFGDMFVLLILGWCLGLLLRSLSPPRFARCNLDVPANRLEMLTAHPSSVVQAAHTGVTRGAR